MTKSTPEFTGLMSKSGSLVFAATVLCAGAFQTNILADGSTGVGPYGYMRVSAEHLRFDDNASSTQGANIKAAGLRGGYMFLPMAGLELRASTTAAEQTWDGTGTAVGGDAKLDYSAAALIRLQANIDPGIAPYVVFGGGTSKVSYNMTSPAVSAGSVTNTGFAGALGLDLQFKSRFTLGVEVGQFVEETMTFGVHAGFDF